MIMGTEVEYQSDAGSIKYTPYLAPRSELWRVFCEYLKVFVKQNLRVL